MENEKDVLNISPQGLKEEAPFLTPAHGMIKVAWFSKLWTEE